MRFRDAKRLHNEDEVIVKETGRVACVLNAWVPDESPKVVLIECDDGNTYTHSELR